MVRCSRSGQQCLTSVVGFDFARFAAAWVWGSCQTVFLCGFHCLTSSCYTCFWHFSSRYVHYVQFYFDKWLLRNIEFWKVIVWKSGRQQGQEAAVCWNSATVFPQALFVRMKKDNQTTHGCILAFSCEFHPRGFKYFFPAKFWKLQSACAHVIPTWTGFHKILHVIFICCHLPRHILSSIIIFSCWAFLVSWLGLWDAPCFWLKVFAKGAGDEKSNEIPAQAVTALQTWTFAFSIQN